MAAKDKLQTKLTNESSLERQILDRWLPYMGCLSYGVYSMKIMQPRRFSEFFGTSAPRIEDTLWTVAGFGIAVFLYRQKCFKQASYSWRIIYSTFGSTFFNLGSNLLMWVSSETVLRESHGNVKILLGLSSGLGLLFVGWHLLAFLNSVTVSDGLNKHKTLQGKAPT